jgi:hypothetical protein
MPSREKGCKACHQQLVERFLRSGFRARIAKYGHFSRISAQGDRNFSAFQTAWRREQDSNPRYGFAALSLDVSVSCRLQNTPQRISCQNLTPGLCNQPVSFAIHSQAEGERRDSLADSGPFERPRRPIGFARDCVPSGQSQNRNLHSERRAPGRRDFSSNCWKNSQFRGRTMVADTLLRKTEQSLFDNAEKSLSHSLDFESQRLPLEASKRHNLHVKCEYLYRISANRGSHLFAKNEQN